MITREKEWLYARLVQQGIEFYPTDANFILIRPPVESREFVRLLTSKGIMVRSTEALGAPGLVRITIGTPEMNQALIKTILSLRFCKIP